MKRKTILVTLVLVGLILGAVLWPKGSTTQTLADGTVLIMSGLQIGRTNVYAHGTWLSRTLGRFAPSNGITLAGYGLRRPTQLRFMGLYQGGDVLSAQFRFMPGSPRETSFVSRPFYRKYRMLISGENDFVFVKEFDRFVQREDGLFAYVYAWSFPRDSRVLHFRLEERLSRDSAQWQEVATFACNNPRPARIESWTPEKLPRFHLPGNVDIEIGQLSVRPERIHPTDIWENMAVLPLRVTQGDQVLTHWGIHDARVRDASGNYDAFGARKMITNNWIEYRAFRPLDPAKLWRFEAGFDLDSDFPATNLFSFAIPWPMAGSWQTNLAGVPVGVEYVHRDMLSVELLEKPTEMRLSFVAAEDEAGTDLDDFAGSTTSGRNSNSPNRRGSTPPLPFTPITRQSSPWNLVTRNRPLIRGHLSRGLRLRCISC